MEKGLQPESIREIIPCPDQDSNPGPSRPQPSLCSPCLNKILQRYTYLFSISFLYISVTLHGSSGGLGSLCSIQLTHIRAGQAGIDSVNMTVSLQTTRELFDISVPKESQPVYDACFFFSVSYKNFAICWPCWFPNGVNNESNQRNILLNIPFYMPSTVP